MRKLIAGLLVVISIFIGAGIASAGTSVVNSEKKYINSQVESQLSVGLRWKSCSTGSGQGQCATTDGDSVMGGRLILGAYPTGVTLELTDAEANNSTVANMDAAIQQITLHYAGRKAVQWLSGVKPPLDSTRHFGPWTVRAIESYSNHGVATLDLTRAN